MSHHSPPFWKGRATLRGLTRGGEEAITSLLSTLHILPAALRLNSPTPFYPLFFFRESRTVLEWQKLSSFQRRFVEDEDEDEEDAILILINICSSTYVCSLQFSSLPWLPQIKEKCFNLVLSPVGCLFTQLSSLPFSTQRRRKSFYQGRSPSSLFSQTPPPL